MSVHILKTSFVKSNCHCFPLREATLVTDFWKGLVATTLEVDQKKKKKKVKCKLSGSNWLEISQNVTVKNEALSLFAGKSCGNWFIILSLIWRETKESLSTEFVGIQNWDQVYIYK